MTTTVVDPLKKTEKYRDYAITYKYRPSTNDYAWIAEFHYVLRNAGHAPTLEKATAGAHKYVDNILDPIS